MSATMEMLAVVEQRPVRHGDVAGQQIREQNKRAPAFDRKRPVERWSSNLAPQDLQCLLSLLEGHVLPRLIASYSPSVVDPVDQLKHPTS